MTPDYQLLLAGDPAPWFVARATNNPRFNFNVAGGRYLVMAFFGSMSRGDARRALSFVEQNRTLFDDFKLSLFGVSIDPTDEQEARLTESLPGIRHFWDFDGQISQQYGVLPTGLDPSTKARPETLPFQPRWVVLDPTMRVLEVLPITAAGKEHARLHQLLTTLPPPGQTPQGRTLPTPVLWLPNVFEPRFCKALIAEYETHGGETSGFMRQVEGKTVLTNDANHKRREDHNLTNTRLIEQARALVHRRVVPEIAKIHQFKVTRMERYLVACYSEDNGGHFRPHRDNTTLGTAHRRFAVSINLNDDFDGGEVRFPEYGLQGFKPPAGGAVVFSCSMLHMVTPVTRGRRYAFLPFLYDDEAARIRERNSEHILGIEGTYRMVTPQESEPPAQQSA